MEPLVSITEGEVAPISVEYFPLMLKLLILLVNLRQRIQAGTQIWPAKIIVMASKRTKNNININLESCVSVHMFVKYSLTVLVFTNSSSTHH